MSECMCECIVKSVAEAPNLFGTKYTSTGDKLQLPQI